MENEKTMFMQTLPTPTTITFFKGNKNNLIDNLKSKVT